MNQVCYVETLETIELKQFSIMNRREYREGNLGLANMCKFSLLLVFLTKAVPTKEAHTLKKNCLLSGHIL